MQDINGTVRRISRRIAYLQQRINSKLSADCVSYDSGEVTALKQALRIIALYNDARGRGNGHVENILNDAADTLDKVLDDNTLSVEARAHVERIRDRCSSGLTMLATFHDKIEQAYEQEAAANMAKVHNRNA